MNEQTWQPNNLQPSSKTNNNKPSYLWLVQVALGLNALFTWWAAWIFYSLDSIDIFTGVELISYSTRTIVGIAGAVLGLLYIIAMLGIQKRRSWAFTVAIIMVIIGFVFSIMASFAIYSLGLNIIVFVLLLKYRKQIQPTK